MNVDAESKSKMADSKAEFGETVVRLFNEQRDQIEINRAYYQRQGAKFKLGARLLRVCILVTLILGVGAQFATELLKNVSVEPVDVLQFGNICLAISAALVFVDRVSLLSENHITKSVTAMLLWFLKRKVELERDLTLSAIDQSPETAQAMRASIDETVKAFAEQHEKTVMDETNSWATARRTAQGVLQEQVETRLKSAQDTLAEKRSTHANDAKAQTDASVPSAINFHLEVPEDYTGSLSVGIKSSAGDVQPTRTVPGSTKQLSFVGVEPGILIGWLQLDDNRLAEATIQLGPNTVETVTLTVA